MLLKPSPHPFGSMDFGVGISCLYFAITGLFVAFPLGLRLDCGLAIVTSAFSFMADFACRGSMWDVVDRLWASAMILYAMSVLLASRGVVTASMFPLFAYCIHPRSKNLRSKIAWTKHHAAWHVGMAIAYGLVVIEKYVHLHRAERQNF